MPEFYATFRTYTKPYYYLFNLAGLNGLNSSYFYRFYAALFLAASTCSYLLPLDFFYGEIFGDVAMSLKVMNQLTPIFMTSGHLLALLSVNFTNRDHLKRFFVLCAKSRTYFNKNLVHHQKKTKKYLIFALIHLKIIVLLCVETLLSTNPLKPTIWLMTEHVLHYGYFLFTALLILSIDLIRANLIDLKRELTDTVFTFKKNASLLEYRKFKELNSIFVDISKSVEHFNATFSWPILMLVFYVICATLKAVSFMIFEMSAFRRSGIYFQYLVVMSAWTAFILVMCFVFTSAANGATKECVNFSRLCYKLTHDFDENTLRSFFKEELVELAEFSFTKMPKFTAAGFFDVDYTMLYRMMTMFTAYLIVLIQFQH